MPYSAATQALVDARAKRGKAGQYTIDQYFNPNGRIDSASTSTHSDIQGAPFSSAKKAPALQVANPNDPFYSRSDIAPLTKATNADVRGAGNYGIRGWLNKHPVGAVASAIAIAAGGAYLVGGAEAFGGASAAGGAGGGGAAVPGAEIGGETAGANAAAAAETGGGTTAGTTSGGSAFGKFLTNTKSYARYAQIGLNLASTAEQFDAARLNKKAAAYQEEVVGRQQAAERRDLVRQIYIARADSIAASAASSTGGLRGSTAMGANSSILSQGLFSLKYFDAQAESERLYRKYLVKGQDKSSLASGIAAASSVIGDIYS